MACRIFLARHGEVDPAWHGRIYGALDVPLSPRGREESARLAARLEGTALDAVLSSGLQRTEFAAALLRSRTGHPRRDVPTLRELERGAWAGLALAALREKDPEAWEAWLRDPATTRPPGGESLQDLRARVLPALADLVRAHPDGTLALVSHGWVSRVVVCEALGLDLNAAPRLDVRTGDLHCLEWQDPAAAPRLTGFALDLPSPQFSE